ncbi:hypothetical protein TNCV_200731 [Trichonephila clavipes]|nr:hypothetical protein TNCV_200731 [Trichonephila clavipes]
MQYLNFRRKYKAAAVTIDIPRLPGKNCLVRQAQMRERDKDKAFLRRRRINIQLLALRRRESVEILKEKTPDVGNLTLVGPPKLFSGRRVSVEDDRAGPKAMIIVSFDINEVVMIEWVSSDQTVNQHCYIEVLKRRREKIREKEGPSCGVMDCCCTMTLDDTALSVKQFLTNKNITVMEHPLYSLD